MHVIDFIKEKSERLAKNKADIMELLQPQLRGYFHEIIESAKSSQWVNWALDQRKLASGSDTVNSDDSTNEWALAHNNKASTTLLQLTEKLGQVTFIGDWLEIDQERINRFADITGDTQWIHTDRARAQQESPFKDTIAHGFLTLSLLPQLTNVVAQTQSPYPHAKMVVNIGLNQVRYPYPVRVGSRLRATKKITHIEPVRRGIELTEEVTVEIENCRRPACVAETVLLLVF